MPGFSVSVVRGSPRKLGVGLALPPTCFTVSSKTKTRSFPNLSSVSPGFAWPTPTTDPQGGAAGGYTLQHLQDTPYPLGSQAPSLTLGMRFSSFPGPLGLDTRGLQELPFGWAPLRFWVVWRRRALWEGAKALTGVGNLTLEVGRACVLCHGVPEACGAGSVADIQTLRACGTRRMPAGKPLQSKRGWKGAGAKQTRKKRHGSVAGTGCE